MDSAEAKAGVRIAAPGRLFQLLHSLSKFLDSNPLIALLLLTTLAGAMRFVNLWHPCLWYDEAMVFRRTCGSYDQLLHCLRIDGFVPLHYSLVWAISRFFKPTPFVLRFVPALCGTLMVPAIYFFSSQMLSRSTAFLAALLTACSAFMLFYSRDAKMYMEAWLFVTVNSGCLLWWLRSHGSTAWLCWIASGAAACGLQMLCSIPIALSVLILLTHRGVQWQQCVLWMIGLAFILAGPIGYYEKFNTWKERTDADWQSSGLDWVLTYNAGRGGPELVRFLSTTLMFGWEWPKGPDIALLPPDRVVWPQRVAECLLGFFVLSCVPWRSRFYTTSRLLPMPEAPCREPDWRLVFWFSVWIVLPVYAFYGRSLEDFSSPLVVCTTLAHDYPRAFVPVTWISTSLMLIAIAVVTFRYKRLRPSLVRWLGILVAVLAVIAICQAMAVVMSYLRHSAAASGKPWQSIWVPRYIGFIWPMVIVATAALLMRLPTIWLRAIAILFLVSINLAVASVRVFGSTEPPVDRMAADAFAAEKSAHQTLLWTHLNDSLESPGGENLYGESGQYYLQLLEDKPTDPINFRSALHNRQRTRSTLWHMPWDRRIAPTVNRIILWTECDTEGTPVAPSPTDPPADWKVQSEEWFTSRDFWIWKDLARYRRTVYERVKPTVSAGS